MLRHSRASLHHEEQKSQIRGLQQNFRDVAFCPRFRLIQLFYFDAQLKGARKPLLQIFTAHVTSDRSKNDCGAANVEQPISLSVQVQKPHVIIVTKRKPAQDAYNKCFLRGVTWLSTALQLRPSPTLCSGRNFFLDSRPQNANHSASERFHCRKFHKRTKEEGAAEAQQQDARRGSRAWPLDRLRSAAEEPEPLATNCYPRPGDWH